MFGLLHHLNFSAEQNIVKRNIYEEYKMKEASALSSIVGFLMPGQPSPASSGTGQAMCMRWNWRWLEALIAASVSNIDHGGNVTQTNWWWTATFVRGGQLPQYNDNNQTLQCQWTFKPFGCYPFVVFGFGLCVEWLVCLMYVCREFLDDCIVWRTPTERNTFVSVFVCNIWTFEHSFCYLFFFIHCT